MIAWARLGVSQNYSDSRQTLKIRGTRKKSATTMSIATLIIAAFLFAYLAVGPFQDKQKHQSILTHLRSLDLHNASLQRDVLRAKVGLLENYDPLVDSIVGLYRDVDALDGLLNNGGVGEGELSRLLDDIRTSVNSDEVAVEGFKTQNALLQNSLRILSRVLEEYGNDSSAAISEISPEVGLLGHLMLEYTIQYDETTAYRIREILERVSQYGRNADPKARLLNIHGRLILSVLPQVYKIIIKLQSSDTVNRAQKMQNEYLEVYGIENSRSQWSRVFLGSASVFLCLYVIVLVHRLRKQTDRLSRRLSFEEAIKKITNCFQEGDRDRDLHGCIDSAITVLRDFFAANHCCIILVNMNTRTVSEQFGHRSNNIITNNFISEMLPKSGVAIQRDLQISVGQDLGHTEGFAGNAIGIKLESNKAAICILEYFYPKPKATSDEAVLLETAVRALLQIVDVHRKQRERETLEKRLEHAERLHSVGTLAGGIAHEFNNILVAILGYGEMVLDLLKRQSVARQYIEEMVKAADRARLTIDQILTLSRKREQTNRPINLVEIVDDMYDLLRVSLPTYVDLISDVSTGNFVVEGNPVEVQQILMNLCKNAGEAIDNSGTISISIDKLSYIERKIISHGLLPPGNYIVLVVKDTGRGIPSTVLPNIFEPFFTTRGKSGGTGLGLSAVYGNVEALGGYVDVTSRINQGTTFTIYIPASAESAVPIQEFFKEQPVPLGDGQVIAVLDTDRKALEAYEDQLAALGYEPVGFSHWNQMSEYLCEEKFPADLLLLDMSSLPRKMLQKDMAAKFKGIPFYLLTQHPEVLPDHIDYMEDVSTLRKPMTSKLLASAIRVKFAKSN